MPEKTKPTAQDRIRALDEFKSGQIVRTRDLCKLVDAGDDLVSYSLATMVRKGEVEKISPGHYRKRTGRLRASQIRFLSASGSIGA